MESTASVPICKKGWEKVTNNTFYSDESIECVVNSSGLMQADCMFMDSLWDPARKGTFRKARSHPLVIFAPTNRSRELHWVLYILERDRLGVPFRWSFGDSLGGRSRRDEVDRIIRLYELTTNDLTLERPSEINIKSMDIPRQNDLVSCGAYVTEAILRYLRNRGWPSPKDMRIQHADIVAKKWQRSWNT